MSADWLIGDSACRVSTRGKPVGIMAAAEWVRSSTTEGTGPGNRAGRVRTADQRFAAGQDVRFSRGWHQVLDDASNETADSAASRAAADSDPLVATLLHELRQPLFAIQNFARAGRRQLQTGSREKCDEYLGQIELQVERIRLLGELLRQLSTRPLALQPNRFRDVAAEAVSQLADWADAKGVVLACEPAADLDTIRCDPVLLRQLLLNLLGNSVAALTASAIAGPRTVRVQTTARGSRLIVDVIDNGPGIDPADIPKLFTPGFSTKDDGSGIGLSLARRIISAHQGTIRLHDHRAGQTTFRLELPLAGDFSAGDSASTSRN